MQILHVTEASWAGTLQVVRGLAAHQAANGHAVTLAYADRPVTPADLAELATGGVELVPLHWTRRSPRAQIAVGRVLRRLVRERRPDVVHLHSSFAGAVGALALPRGVPLIYTPHGLAFARKGVARPAAAAARAVEALVARRSALLGAVSEAEAELARRGLHAPRVAVARNGIPELDGDRSGAAPERAEPVVVAMGRVTAARQPAATARILSALARDARVSWIGGGGEDDAPVREAGIPVTGWLPRAEALERLGEATVYLHWSAWDGQSLALLEAFARDVVVVASDIAANREVVGPRQICADEAAAIALARSILASPELRDELLADQRSRGAAFGAARAGAEWLALYEQVLDRPAVARMQPATAAAAGRKIGGPWN
ncbi:MAG: glycosyltransferase family 4 protein [Solirubrobacteraceae bacterium]